MIIKLAIEVHDGDLQFEAEDFPHTVHEALCRAIHEHGSERAAEAANWLNDNVIDIQLEGSGEFDLEAVKSLLNDLTLLFEDSRLPAATLADRIRKYSEHQRRVEARFFEETGMSAPSPEVPNARPATEYREAQSAWLQAKAIIRRLFELVEAMR